MSPLIVTAVINLIGSVITSYRVGNSDETTRLLNDYAGIAENKIQDVVKAKTSADVDLAFLSDFITVENVDKVKNTIVSKVKNLFKKKESVTYADAVTVSDGNVSVNEEQLYEAAFADFILYVSEKDPELFRKIQSAMHDFTAESEQSPAESEISKPEVTGQTVSMKSMDLFGGGSNG